MIKTLHVGQRVTFKDHVFEGRYVPYYDAYKGHEFEVTGYLEDEGTTVYDHVLLKCTTVPMGSFVAHDFDLLPVPTESFIGGVASGVGNWLGSVVDSIDSGVGSAASATLDVVESVSIGDTIGSIAGAVIESVGDL